MKKPVQLEAGSNKDRPKADITGAQSIARTVRLLRLVAEGEPDGLTLAELGEKAGLHRATAHRLLAALARERLVEQDASHYYHPGVELWIMGKAAARRFDIREIAYPAMERLAVETKDTVFLSIPSGDEAICIARCEGAFPIRTLTLNVGDRRPLGVGSGSLALLAFLPEPDRRAILDRIAPKLTPYPRYTPAVLRDLVEKTRAQGYSLVGGTIVTGMSAVGVPVLDHNGHAIAALSVAAIDARMAEPRRTEIVRIAQAEAALVAGIFTSGRGRPLNLDLGSSGRSTAGKRKR
ncbi:MAG: IclR family transcriptional regulator [Thermodesulfobacteriota bacterium]